MIKTGRVRRNYDSAIENKMICPNMLFMAIAALQYQINYNDSASDKTIAKYQQQRKILAECAIKHDIDKSEIADKVTKISSVRYPSANQISRLTSVVLQDKYWYSANENEYLSVFYIPDSDLIYMNNEEISERKKQIRISRNETALCQEQDFWELCLYIENEVIFNSLTEEMIELLQKMKTSEYTYAVILKTFQWNESVIRNRGGKKFDSEYSEFKYIMGIIYNKLSSTLAEINRRHENEMRFWEDNAKNILTGEQTLEEAVYLQCDKYDDGSYYGKHEIVKNELLAALNRLRYKNNNEYNPKAKEFLLPNGLPEKWIPKDNESHEIFESKLHTDIHVMEVLAQEFGKIEYGRATTVEDICKETWVIAGEINTERIYEYCTEVLTNKQ